MILRDGVKCFGQGLHLNGSIHDFGSIPLFFSFEVGGRDLIGGKPISFDYENESLRPGCDTGGLCFDLVQERRKNKRAGTKTSAV